LSDHADRTPIDTERCTMRDSIDAQS